MASGMLNNTIKSFDGSVNLGKEGGIESSQELAGSTAAKKSESTTDKKKRKKKKESSKGCLSIVDILLLPPKVTFGFYNENVKKSKKKEYMYLLYSHCCQYLVLQQVQLFPSVDCCTF